MAVSGIDIEPRGLDAGVVADADYLGRLVRQSNRHSTNVSFAALNLARRMTPLGGIDCSLL